MKADAAWERGIDRFAVRLVREPSPAGQEGAVAQLVAAEMQRLGLSGVTIDTAGNVIGRVGSGEPPVLLLNGHMDNVPPGDPAAWPHPPFAGDVEHGVLYGRGACDMKGGLAGIVHAAGLIADARLKGTLYVMAVVQEETCEGLGAKMALDELGVRPDFVILAEPSNMRLALGHRGRLMARVVTRGRAAHGSAPERGDNAIYKMARAALAVEGLNGRLPSDPVLGRASASLNTVCGGTDTIVVPESCEAMVDRRMTAGESETGAVAELREAIAAGGSAADVQVIEYEMASYTGAVLRSHQVFPAWHTSPDHPLAVALSRAAQDVTGSRPEHQIWAFSTDGAYLAGVAGIPTVGYGPGEERFAHTVDDQVRLADVRTAARVYAELARGFLG